MKKSRSNKKKHLAAVAVIFDQKGQVLLVKRNEPRATHAHGKWSFPGGGIEFGEHPRETVVREVREEIGLEIQLLSDEPFIWSHLFDKEQVHAVLFTFPAVYTSGIINISGDRETADARWHKLDEINFTLCMPQVESMIKTALKYL